jgi:acetyl esterase/lipase
MKLRSVLTLLAGSLLVLCGGCTRVELLNATIPRDGYSVVKDIPYGADERQKLDIYVPTQPAAGNPVIVFYYGGSWQEGNKDDYLFAGQAFASKGFITVVADYRLYPQVYFPTFMADVADAFAWTHQHIAAYGGNPDNMFATGHSAGAYNAIMLTLNRQYLQAAGGNDGWIRGAIGIAGPYDFLPLIDPQIVALFSKEPANLTQPITFARPDLPPLLLLTGDKDTDVLPRNSIHLTERLHSMGDDVTLKIYPNLAHISIALSLADGFRDKAPVLDDVAAFVNTHIQGNTAGDATTHKIPVGSAVSGTHTYSDKKTYSSSQ